MTAQPDPQRVREIAREAIRVAITSGRDAHINYAICAARIPEVVDGTFMAYRNAVAAEYDTQAAALSWPDEQSQAERCTCGCPKVGDGCDCRFCNEPYPTAVAVDFRNVTEDDARKWREAFNAAAGKPLVVSPDFERAQAERDADVRAVAALLKLGDASFRGALTHAAVESLRARFAKRIAALDAGEGGEASCPCGCPQPGIPDMCCCPEPCPCGTDCGFCGAPPGA